MQCNAKSAESTADDFDKDKSFGRNFMVVLLLVITTAVNYCLQYNCKVIETTDDNSEKNDKSTKKLIKISVFVEKNGRVFLTTLTDLHTAPGRCTGASGASPVIQDTESAQYLADFNRASSVGAGPTWTTWSNNSRTPGLCRCHDNVRSTPH